MAKQTKAEAPPQVSAGHWTYYDPTVHGPQAREGAGNRSDDAPLTSDAKMQEVPPGVVAQVDTEAPAVVQSK